MTRSLIYDLLTESQRENRELREEKLDSRGIFVRYRVEDQTIFDAFLLRDLITRMEHDGLIAFANDVERSGCSPASCSLEPKERTVSYKVGDKLASRWLAYSFVYRMLERRGVKKEADIILSIIPSMYDWKAKFGEDKLPEICESIRPSLPVIAKFYGCVHREDPRDIININGGPTR